MFRQLGCAKLSLLRENVGHFCGRKFRVGTKNRLKNWKMLLGNVHKAHDKTLLIMKHSDPLLRRAPVAPSQSRSHVQVRAVPRNAATNSRKAKEDSTSRIERTAETVEFVALALAAGGHALAAADRQRSINNTNLPTETRRAEPTSTAADILPRTSAIDSFWLSAPLLLAVAARSIATRLAK